MFLLAIGLRKEGTEGKKEEKKGKKEKVVQADLLPRLMQAYYTCVRIFGNSF